MPVIHFIDINRKVECVPGANLREIAIREGYDVYKGIHKLINCRGEGLCGTCQIAVTGRAMPRNATEEKRLKNIGAPWRLACQFQVLDNIEVTCDPQLVAERAKAEQDRLAHINAQAKARAENETLRAEVPVAEAEAAEAEEEAKQAEEAAADAGHEAKIAREAADGVPEGPAKAAAEAAAKKAHEAASEAMHDASEAKGAANQAKAAAKAGDEATAHTALEKAEAAEKKATEADKKAQAQAKKATEAAAKSGKKK
ncbi:MAG: 2Fe-2S iron-sulfur cluster-binding protein [Leptospirillia bacterium]